MDLVGCFFLAGGKDKQPLNPTIRYTSRDRTMLVFSVGLLISIPERNDNTKYGVVFSCSTKILLAILIFCNTHVQNLSNKKQ